MLTTFAEVLTTSDASSTTYYQKIICPKNILLHAVRSYVVQYNSPTYTSLEMKLYSNNAGLPKALIATSSSVVKATAFTDNSGWKEIYFAFTTIPQLKASETYHLVLNATGYTGSDTSYIAWAHSYPDPAYRTNVDLSYQGLLNSPYHVSLFGKYL